MSRRRTIPPAPSTVADCLRHLAFTARVCRAKSDPAAAMAWAEVEILLAKLASEQEAPADAL